MTDFVILPKSTKVKLTKVKKQPKKGTLLKFYLKHTKKDNPICSVSGCKKVNVYGACISPINNKKNQYIVPLCLKHNDSKKELKLKETKAVSPYVKKKKKSSGCIVL